MLRAYEGPMTTYSAGLAPQDMMERDQENGVKRKFSCISQPSLEATRYVDAFKGEMEQMFPSTTIIRIMKDVLAPEETIDGEVKMKMQECLLKFIQHVTNEACSKCEREGRKAITGDDLLWSVDRLGFRGYQAPLRLFLRKHRAIETEDRLRKRQAGLGPRASSARLPPATAFSADADAAASSFAVAGPGTANQRPPSAAAAIAMPLPHVVRSSGGITKLAAGPRPLPDGLQALQPADECPAHLPGGQATMFYSQH